MKRLSHKQLRRLLALAAIVVLLTMSLAGCKKDLDQEDPDESTPPASVDATDPINEETEVPDETQAPAVMGTVNTDKLNVRTDPDSNSPSIQKLAVGTRVEILEQKVVEDVTWGKIADGWVNMKYVTLDDEKSPITDDPTGADIPLETTPPTTPTEKTEGTTGTITASELNIRSGPGTNYKATGIVKKGDEVVILEKSGNWGRTKDGWVSLKYVKLDGTIEESETTETTTGTATSKTVIITGSELNIRSTAGTDGKKVGSYKYGEQVSITEQTTVDGSLWGKTSKGWISLKYTYVQGEKGDGAGTGTVTADKLNVRSGPGKDYKKVDQVKSGDKVEIYAQIKIGTETWGYTTDGWVSMEYVKMG